MASIFGDDGVEDLLNDNLNGDQELPGDEEDGAGDGERLFGEVDDVEAGADGDADTQKAVKVEPKKRSVQNPRPRLTVETLRGPRGIHTIEEYFKDVKYKGKGSEKQDLDEVLRRLQHWAHRMYPTYKFDDVLTNIERLGKKKPLQVHMSRYRLGMLENLGVSADNEVHDEDEEGAHAAVADEPFDEFDALLGEQIAISKLAPRTPAQSNRHAGDSIATTSNSAFSTPSFSRGNAVMSTPYTGMQNYNHQYKQLDDSELARPLPPSQPASPAPALSVAAKELTAEQQARIAENRRIALERLLAKKARLQQQQEQQQAQAMTEVET